MVIACVIVSVCGLALAFMLVAAWKMGDDDSWRE